MKGVGSSICALAATICTTLAGPASADWRAELGTLRIGVLGQAGAGAVYPGAARIEGAFSRELGVPVEMFVARDLPSLIQAQTEGRVHYVVHSALAYAIAAVRCGCVEPVAAPLSADGSAGFRSILIARRAAPARTPRIAMVAGDDLASHAVPLASYRHDGKRLSGTESFLVTRDNPSDAVSAFAVGEADAVFGWVAVDAGGTDMPGTGTMAALETVGVARDEVEVRWSSPVIPFGPHAVRSDVPAEARRRLAAYLRTLFETDRDLYDLLERRFDGGMRAIGKAAYEPLESVVRQAGETVRTPEQR